MTNVNVTGIQYFQSNVTYLGNGVYQISITAYKILFYKLHVYVLEASGVYTEISNSPLIIYVLPTYPSAIDSTASGSGVTNAIVGGDELIYL